jgi:hypothetical protein
MSIYGHGHAYEERDGVTYLTSGTLISVDLVDDAFGPSASTQSAVHTSVAAQRLVIGSGFGSCVGLT